MTEYYMQGRITIPGHMRRPAEIARAALAAAVFLLPFFAIAAAEKPRKTQGKNEDKGKEFEILLALARGQQEETADEEENRRNMAEALSLYQQMIDLGATDSMRREAFWGIAVCCFRLGRLWEAYKAVEQSFPESFEPKAVAERTALEYQIALGLMRFGNELAPNAAADGRDLTGYEAASRVFHAIVYNDARAVESPFALVGEGDCLAEIGDWPGAQKAYRRFLREHARHEMAAEVKAALARALVAAGGVKAAALEEAAALAREAETAGEVGERLRLRLEAYRLARQEIMAAELLDKADFYVRQKTAQGRKAALFTWQEVMRKYPETKAAKAAAARLATWGKEPHAADAQKEKTEKEEP